MSQKNKLIVEVQTNSNQNTPSYVSVNKNELKALFLSFSNMLHVWRSLSNVPISGIIIDSSPSFTLLDSDERPFDDKEMGNWDLVNPRVYEHDMNLVWVHDDGTEFFISVDRDSVFSDELDQ